jgi:hypothetical protein
VQRVGRGTSGPVAWRLKLGRSAPRRECSKCKLRQGSTRDAERRKMFRVTKSS